MWFHLTSLLFGAAVVVYAFPGTLISRDEDLQESYDYVIVGGGLSGLVVANRLTEDPKVTVLVIEAGPILEGEAENEVLVPRFMSNYTDATYTWGLTGAPNVGLNNRTTPIRIAKLVGGGSAINGMFLDRGSQSDYNQWAEYTGDDGWGWESLLNYFKKVETFTPPPENVRKEFGIEWDPEAHGTNGPVHSTYPPWIWPTFKPFLRALKDLGIPMSKDGAMNAIGTFFVPNSMDPKDNTRSYAKTAYHDVSKKRDNYQLIVERLVTKLLFDRNKKAICVNFSVGPAAKAFKVFAKTEIILAAGAIKSAQLLQLSGIGDKRLLERFDIPLVVDLPGVGNNYQDHSGVLLDYKMTLEKDKDPDQLLTNATYYNEMLELYWKTRTGPFTYAGGNYASFLPLPMITSEYAALIAAAKTQAPGAYLRDSIHSTLLAGYTLQKSILLRDFATNHSAVDEQIFTLASVQKPLSRGYVEISTIDPFTLATVNFRTISNPFDLAVVTAGIHWVRRIMKHPEIQVLKPVENAPGAAVDTPEEMEKYVRNSMLPTFWHPSGTCAMGKRELGAVVDTKLRVYGVKGLRVVDAGIIPLIPATHLSNTVYAIAERAADLIRGKVAV